MNSTAVEAIASETPSNSASGLAFAETTDAGETLGSAVSVIADQASPLNYIVEVGCIRGPRPLCE